MQINSIKRIRTQWKLTHAQLAEHLGVMGRAVQYYESGNLATPRSVLRLAALLNEHWALHGYKSPEEMWSPTKPEDTEI